MSAVSLRVRNVNHALPSALGWLKAAGVLESSRNGPVLVAPGPVLMEYERPLERVLFSPTRDANPFFHFFEALWMLAGRNDVGYVAQFNKRMAKFSDDGEYLHGAYGFRWREWFAFDQLEIIVEHLKEQPNSRRAVLTMWSPSGDLVTSEGEGGLSAKDVPCNTHCYFDLRNGVLNMSVMCRSNDAVWGAYGANAVHFAFLMEYMAMQLGVDVGRFYQYSHNLHLYTDKFDEGWRERVISEATDPYEYNPSMLRAFTEGASETPEHWERDLQRFMRHGPGADCFCSYFEMVAKPLLQAYKAYRDNDFYAAQYQAGTCAAFDWRTACNEWLVRRFNARLK